MWWLITGDVIAGGIIGADINADDVRADYVIVGDIRGGDSLVTFQQCILD